MISRTTVPVLLSLVLAAVGGCGGADDDLSATTGTPATTSQETSEGTADGADWADGICAATLDVQVSIDELGTSIQVDVGSGTAALEQVKQQVAVRAEALAADVEALADAVRALPDPPDPDLTAAAQDLEDDRQALSAAVGDLRAAVSDATAAEDAASFLQAVPAVAEQLAVTRLQATALRGGLQELATVGSETVRASIAEADACGELLVQP
jgi:hypothetical protein